MGQIWSDLWKSGDVVNDPRGPQTLRICAETDAQSHVSAPSDVLFETSESKIYEIGGEGSEEAVSEPPHIRLPDLCEDVLIMIAAYLPPSGRMSLNYSCPRIRAKLGDSIEKLLGEKDQLAQLPRKTLHSRLLRLTAIPGGGFEWSLPAMPQNLHHTERLSLLIMLDRDGKLPPSKAVCSGCADTHDRSLFSRGSLAQSSGERRCLGSTGHIWICPHWIFDHNLVTTSPRPQGIHRCGKRLVPVISMSRDCTGPIIMWPIVMFPGSDDPPSKKQVTDILARTDVRVCKHVNFSADSVSSLYSPDCNRLWMDQHDSFCPCSMCAQQIKSNSVEENPNWVNGVTCDVCGAHASFKISYVRDGKRTLMLVVSGRIPDFRGCTDHAWIERVDDPGEFKDLERKWWKATDEEVEVLPEVRWYQWRWYQWRWSKLW